MLRKNTWRNVFRFDGETATCPSCFCGVRWTTDLFFVHPLGFALHHHSTTAEGKCFNRGKWNIKAREWIFSSNILYSPVLHIHHTNSRSIKVILQTITESYCFFFVLFFVVVVVVGGIKEPCDRFIFILNGIPGKNLIYVSTLSYARIQIENIRIWRIQFQRV